MESFYKISLDIWFEIIKYLDASELFSLRIINHHMKDIILMIEKRNIDLFCHGDVKISMKCGKMEIDFTILDGYKKWNEIFYPFKYQHSYNYLIFINDIDYCLRMKKSFEPKLNFDDSGKSWLIKNENDTKNAFGITKSFLGKTFFRKSQEHNYLQFLMNREVPIFYYLIHKFCMTSFEEFDLEKEPFIIKSLGFFECINYLNKTLS